MLVISYYSFMNFGLPNIFSALTKWFPNDITLQLYNVSPASPSLGKLWIATSSSSCGVSPRWAEESDGNCAI